LGWSRSSKLVGSAWENLKHRLFDLIELAFWAAQGAKYEFKVLWEHLKHRFQFAIRVSQEAENEFKISMGKL